MPADRDLTKRVTALGAQVVSVLRGSKSTANAAELQRCLDDLAVADKSHLDALRKIEAMCGPKWLGDDALGATSRSDWDELLRELRGHANEAAVSVFRKPSK